MEVLGTFFYIGPSFLVLYPLISTIFTSLNSNLFLLISVSSPVPLGLLFSASQYKSAPPPGKYGRTYHLYFLYFRDQSPTVPSFKCHKIIVSIHLLIVYEGRTSLSNVAIGGNALFIKTSV